MIPIIERQQERLEALCRELDVKRLDLFGSATRNDFAANSDLDFAVSLEERAPAAYAEAWLTLQTELEKMFGRRIDLVTLDAIRNPYFRDRLMQTRKTLYVA